MQRSSQTIGAIASALAKAQLDLTNPEKSLTATIRSPGDPYRLIRREKDGDAGDIIRRAAAPQQCLCDRNRFAEYLATGLRDSGC